jgi:site-specific recombinase XerD
MKARKRKRVGKGIYRDPYSLSAVVKVGSGDRARARWKRFPLDTDHARIKAWQDAIRAELRRALADPAPSRDTLAADVTRYLPQVAAMVSYKPRVSELKAWTALYGHLRRMALTAEHIRLARATWAADDYAPKTINNRVQALEHLFHVLDGKRAPTPVDDLDDLAVPEGVKMLVPATVFQTVATNLEDAKTRARFKVIATTGVRPSELKRAQPGDVTLSRHAWIVRTGKRGQLRALFLNGEMEAALTAFIAAEAWGDFDGSAYAKLLYAAGWPKDVRPYQARHSAAMELGERGVDMTDVADFLGHRDITTTRKHYAPILASRLKRASEALAAHSAHRDQSFQPIVITRSVSS